MWTQKIGITRYIRIDKVPILPNIPVKRGKGGGRTRWRRRRERRSLNLMRKLKIGFGLLQGETGGKMDEFGQIGIHIFS
jgi:hypothetical protein